MSDRPFGACGLRKVLGQPPHADHGIDAGLGRGPAALGVQHRALGAELQHLPRHQDAARPLLGQRRGSQRGHHRIQRMRVGVVAVVDQPRALQFQHRTALLGRAQLFQRIAAGAQRDAARQAHGDSRQRVQDVVPPQQRKVHRVLFRAGLYQKARARQAELLDLHGADQGARRRTVEHGSGPRRPALAEAGDPRVIGIQKRGAGLRQRLHQLPFCPGHPFQAIRKELRVHGGYVGDHRPVRFGNRR